MGSGAVPRVALPTRAIRRVPRVVDADASGRGSAVAVHEGYVHRTGTDAPLSEKTPRPTAAVAFLSDNHLAADLAAEVFVLEADT